jgi:aspartate/methionine/tyrosine aminotransferase
VKKQAKRMEKIPVSAIRKMFAEVDRLKAEGKKVISLGVGEPDFDTPPHIVEAMIQAGLRGEHHYTANKGIVELRRAICKKLKEDNGLEYDVEEIICTVGVSEAIYASMTALLDPGDEILVPNPAWVNYTHVPVMAGATPVHYTLRQENDFQVDFDELESKVTDKTKMIAMISPSNPTGAVQSYETLKKLAEFTVKHDLVMVSDEIYEKILFDGAKHYSLASFPGMRERTIVLNGFAKAYAMTGWRMGYIAAPMELIGAIARLHAYNVTHTTSVAQWAALAALEGPQDAVEAMVKEFDRRRLYMLDALNNTKGVTCARPKGAFYLFPSIKDTGLSEDEVVNYLLKEASVAVIPGTAFGSAGKGHVRISYATSYENIVESAAAIQRAFAKL